MFKIIKSGEFDYLSKGTVIIQNINRIQTYVRVKIHVTPDGIYSDSVEYAGQYLSDYTDSDEDLPQWLTKEQQIDILKKYDAEDSIIDIQEICSDQFSDYVDLVNKKSRDGSSNEPTQYLYTKQTLANIYGYIYDSGLTDSTMLGHKLLKCNGRVRIADISDDNHLIVIEIPDGLECGEDFRKVLTDQVIQKNTIRAYDIYSDIQYAIHQGEELDKLLQTGALSDQVFNGPKTDEERYLSALGLRDKDFVKWLTRYLSNSLNEETKASSEKIAKAIESLVDTEKSLRESDQTKIDSLNETVSKLNELISSNTESNNQIKQAIASLTQAYKQIHKKTDKVEEIQQDQFNDQVAKSPDQIIRDITSGSGDILDKIKNILKFKKAVILAGAPGTGKTTIARCIAKEITSDNVCDNAYVEIKRDNGTQYIRYEDKLKGALKKYLDIVQFSAQYSYEDFVSGLKTDENGNWTLTPGAFKLMCDKAQKDKDNKYVLIIDEINRANTEEVLGEMFNLMESRGTEITSRTGEKLVMPENLYIIATMNSIDRGAGQLDMATISRFAVVNIAAPSAKQMINDVDKIPAIKDHPELNEDLKDKLRDKLKVAISLIDKLNNLINDDNDAAVLNKDALKLGYRSLFSQDISQVGDINLIIEYDIKSDIDARQDKLSKQTYENCIEEIKAAIKRDKPVDKAADVVETDTVETGEQS